MYRDHVSFSAAHRNKLQALHEPARFRKAWNRGAVIWATAVGSGQAVTTSQETSQKKKSGKPSAHAKHDTPLRTRTQTGPLGLAPSLVGVLISPSILERSVRRGYHRTSDHQSGNFDPHGDQQGSQIFPRGFRHRPERLQEGSKPGQPGRMCEDSPVSPA